MKLKSEAKIDIRNREKGTSDKKKKRVHYKEKESIQKIILCFTWK